jgi:hypothetical protein
VSTNQYAEYLERERLFHFDGRAWRSVTEPLNSVEFVRSIPGQGTLAWGRSGALFYQPAAPLSPGQ